MYNNDQREDEKLNIIYFIVQCLTTLHLEKTLKMQRDNLIKVNNLFECTLAIELRMR